MSIISACILIIGNEILSGRTHDKNLPWLANELNKIGIRVLEVRVIADDEAVIIDTVNSCRTRFDYIFTTGGIGPTHDDITSACIAKAFGLPLVLHPQAKERLERHYGDQLNEARLKMAYMPRGSSLIDNPVSAAPGFYLNNVYVMAGVPSIMQAMFDSIKHRLHGGLPMLSKTISAFITEGVIATELSAIQERHPQVEIGSYPFVKSSKLGTSLVVRGTNTEQINGVYEEIKSLLFVHTEEVTEE